mgnify:CR=1 FL=1
MKNQKNHHLEVISAKSYNLTTSGILDFPMGLQIIPVEFLPIMKVKHVNQFISTDHRC